MMKIRSSNQASVPLSVRWTESLMVMSCLLFALALLLLHQAKPEMYSFLDSHWHKEARVYWDSTFLGISLWSFIAVLIACSAGLTIDIFARRKVGSRTRMLLIVLGIGAFLSVLAHQMFTPVT